MVVGVSQGFDKKLQLIGVGYRAVLEGNILVLSLGFSHPVRMTVPQGLKVKVEENTRITVSGYDKSEVSSHLFDGTFYLFSHISLCLRLMEHGYQKFIPNS